MQRKNYLLKRAHRSAIAMIMAIFVLVVLATIMAFSIEMSAKTGKRVVQTYVANQANLFAKNAAEYAVYKISKDKNCSTTSFNTTLQKYYHVNVNISYILSDTTTGCPLSTITLMPMGEENGYAYARIDVSVTVDNDALAIEPVRIFRRYIEDITPYVY